MKYFLFLFFCFSITQAQAQHILAGNWGSFDYYFDFNPDSVLNTPPNYTKYSTSIDLNGDQKNDFQISVYYHLFSSWNYKEEVTIRPLFQNQIAHLPKDSCMTDTFYQPLSSKVFNYYPIRIYEHLESIDSNALWTDSVVSISHKTGDVVANYNCYFPGFSNIQQGFIGLRVFTNSTIDYGWLQIGDVKYSNLTIDDMASTSFIKPIIDDPIILVGPNPTDGLIQINGTKKIRNIYIFNLTGQLLFKKEETSNKSILNLSKWSPGVYLLSIINEDNSRAQKKIIIQ